MAMLDEFDQHRSALLGLAYRMLGSVMDAEDLLQDAFLQWQKTNHSQIASSKAYLMTMTARMCIDHLRLAHVQREEYVGSWLPEPLLQIPDADPAQMVELADTLSTAFLMMLERLTPLERATFLLHEVFGYSYEEIGGIVNRNVADCRQIAHRARTRLGSAQSRFSATTQQAEAIAQRFIHACAVGDMSELLTLISPDVTLWSDGGGKVSAALKPIFGMERVARFFAGIHRKRPNPPTYKVIWLSGQIAILEYPDNYPLRLTTFRFENNMITDIYRLMNPDKLKGLPL